MENKMANPIKIGNKFRIRPLVKGKRVSEYYDDRATALLAIKRHELENLEYKSGFKKINTIALTFDQLGERWVKYRLPQKRKSKDDLCILNKYLLPYFGKSRIKDIKIINIEDFKLTISHLKPKTQYNILALFRAMLNYAADHEWMDRVPKIKMPKIEILDTEYSFLKSDREIERFLEAAKKSSHRFYVLCAMAIYTGMRQGEIACLKWEDVDLKSQQITVKQSFNGPTKNGKIRYVPILNILLPVLREWRLQNPLEYVFFNDIGRPLRPCQRIFQETFKKVLDDAGFKKRSPNKHYIVFHDLRHTFASHWMMKGGDIYKLKNILGHSDIKMTQRYAHLSPDAFQNDLNLFDSTKIKNQKFFQG